MEVSEIKNKVIIILVCLISLSCLSCVNAENPHESDLGLNEEYAQDLEVSMNSNDALSQSEDNNLLNSENDGDTSSNETATNNESQAYLILDNDADKENVYIGDYVTWILSVINNGPDTAKNVKVFDELPDGLKYITHVTTKGTFNPGTGIWSIGDLAVSEGEVFLNITTQALSAGEKINKANLTSDTYNLNENESYEEEEIDVFEHEAKAYSTKSIDSSRNAETTGNPIALIVLSLFAIFITSIKSN